MTWQPIETAPKDGTFVDLWVVDGTFCNRMTDCHWYKNDWFSHELQYGDGDWLGTIKATHWMPVPDPPST